MVGRFWLGRGAVGLISRFDCSICIILSALCGKSDFGWLNILFGFCVVLDLEDVDLQCLFVLTHLTEHNSS